MDNLPQKLSLFQSAVDAVAWHLSSRHQVSQFAFKELLDALNSRGRDLLKALVKAKYIYPGYGRALDNGDAWDTRASP